MPKRLRGRKKVSHVLHEFKQGDLKSSSGQVVRKKDQAIAIALSEAGMSKKRTLGEISQGRPFRRRK